MSSVETAKPFGIREAVAFLETFGLSVRLWQQQNEDPAR
jgi:hypothetical protein